MKSRRKFLKTAGALGLTAITARLAGKDQIDAIETFSKLGADPAFVLPKLPYSYNAMEPFIDKLTMEIHHSKHHQAYVNKLNETPSTNMDYMSDDATKCTHVDKTTSMVIRNNLGGHYNHSLFWLLLKPNPEGYKNMAEGKLAEAIVKEFKSFEEFQKQFAEKASKHFGSGWCWLIEQNGKLKITTTPNQDNPLMNLDHERGKIILGLDVWEHAYYLKYQNKRADYISNWWNVVNWNKAEELFNTK
ncbi:MAG: sod [Bacteroidetes bacterium]|jgi:Fe-Mn family superoxide dismutase|nr:sod [Bacteroidota bacterium]